MKVFIFTAFFIFINVGEWLWKNFNSIYLTNQLQERAHQLYENKNYKEAIGCYNQLLYEYHMTDEKIYLNIAHCYYLLKNYALAEYFYKNLLKSKNHHIRSIGNLQTGIIMASLNKPDVALNYFREALKADPGNYKARFNYEYIKHLRDQQQETSGKKKNNNGKNKLNAKTSDNKEILQDNRNNKNSFDDSDYTEHDDEMQRTKDHTLHDLKPGEQGKLKMNALSFERLKEMNITPEQAAAILQALKNEEIQYVHQLKKKKAAKHTLTQPDW
ncbi:MAG: hypothetical protein NZ529_01170 [Cytophagaceae bacterium]|nr:hypothetical protein [Cytophagaceae bacterium]MDW8455375.1 hypothetical protein [Cytophagaceae bacterium]